MYRIAWVAIWKVGRSWNARAFWLNADSDMIEDEDMQDARDIVAADVIRQIIWSRFRQFIWMCSQVQIAYWSG